MSDILSYIYKSSRIRCYISNLLSKNRNYMFNSDDVMSHTLLEISKKEISILLELYNTKKLEIFTKGVIRNQLKSNNSSLHKEYSLVYKSGEKNKLSSIDDYDFKYQNDDYDSEIDITISKIEEYLLSIEPTKALLFKLYYYESMTYSDIAREIGIDKQVVRLNVIKVLNTIRQKIDDNLEYG